MRFPDVSRTIVSRLIQEGQASVDGTAATKALRLKPGQTVVFRLPKPGAVESAIAGEKMPLKILYEDQDIAAVAKAPGICVHPAPGHRTGTLVNALLHLYPRMGHVGSILRPGVIHRLDLDTSGVILFALTPRAYTVLVRMIKERALTREYLTVVHGVPAADTGTINMPIGRDPAHRRRFAVLPNSASAKRSVTHFTMIERYASASLVRVRLETGRTHQIRVHMKAIGHPVIGDDVYAAGRVAFPITRQALHAHKLSFIHPFLKQSISLEAPVPDDMTSLIDFLRRHR